MSMILNNVPSLTWNSLKVNHIEAEDPSFTSTLHIPGEVIPHAFSCRSMSFAEAEEWIAVNAPKEPAENVVAGKIPIYHPQAMATGLGADYDQLMAESETSVDFLDIPAGTTLEKPISWKIRMNAGDRSVAGGLIHVGAHAKVTMIIREESDRDASGALGISTRVVLDEGASFTLVQAQMLGKEFTHFSDVGATLAEDADFRLIELQLGAKRVYNGLQAELMEKNANLAVKIGYIGTDNDLIDMNYNAVLRGAKANAEMTFDGVLDDKAVKRLADTIDFRRGAKAAKGVEHENVLLLNGNEMINQSLPIILCEEEDMEGLHGATIGQLSDDVLFYLASRGISKEEAVRIMVRARLGAVADNIRDEELQGDLQEFIEEVLRS